jgi:redox-sensing transcriptional repressor
MPSADISIAVVTVPASCAQHAVDELTRAGIRAILNYAPITLEVADDVVVRDIDPVRMLQSMTYHLRG